MILTALSMKFKSVLFLQNPNIKSPLDRDIEETTFTIRQHIFLNYHKLYQYFHPQYCPKIGEQWEKVENLRQIFWHAQVGHHMSPAGEDTGGPSGGIVETTAVISAEFGWKLLPGMVFTGEIEKFGKINKIGGERLKMQAMFTQGASHAVFPIENRKGVILALEGIVEDSHLDRGQELKLFPENIIPGEEIQTEYRLVKASQPTEGVLTVRLVSHFDDVLPLGFPRSMPELNVGTSSLPRPTIIMP